MKRPFFIPERNKADAAALSFEANKPWLAPLAGYSDLPFRLLCRELGAAVCETEMISAKGMFYKTPDTSDLFLSHKDDFPLVVQLFGSEPECMAWAVLYLRKLGYSAFDCNMGCPARKVARQGAGSALLKKPDQALAIASAMLEATKMTGPDLPEQPAKLGFKFRLDPERKPGFSQDFGRRLEDMGASWLCLHPRTAQEGFGGQAHWEEIASLAGSVTIPVIASGDINGPEKAFACLKQTGAACVMYARASLANPYVFRQHDCFSQKKPIPALSREGLKEIIERHISLTKESCGDRRAFAKIRSIIPRYVRNFSGVNKLRQALCKCEDWESLRASLAEFMAKEAK